jgi:hypothetical protein
MLFQFVQPAHNASDNILPTDFSRVLQVPVNVQQILIRACYDCHSNNTKYPWYSSIQPVAWMMSNHIREGKKMLNFSEFGGYSSRRQISKLKAIASQVKDGYMPIGVYKMMHSDARLNDDEKKMLEDWTNHVSDSILAKL